MNDESMNHKLERDESEAEDMLEEYDFSNAKPGRHRGFKGSLIRVLEDGTEQAIELKPKNARPNVERDRRQIQGFPLL